MTQQITFYAHVQATYGTSYYNKDKIASAKVTRVTQNRPENLNKNTVAVKLTLDMPDEAFKPFEPQVNITIDPNLVAQQVHVISEAKS